NRRRQSALKPKEQPCHTSSSQQSSVLRHGGTTPECLQHQKRARSAQQRRYKQGTALILSDTSYRLGPLQSRFELFDSRPRSAKQTKQEWPPGDTPLAHFPNRLHRTPDLTEIQCQSHKPRTFARKENCFEELESTFESGHASYHPHGLRHCSRRGFRGLAARTR